MDRSDVLIVGSGHAGAHAAIQLRQNGFGGTVTMLTRDSEFPYERPPLSKEYFAGEKTFERLLLRPESFWEERAIRIERGCEVLAVDPQDHVLTAADGRRFGYGKLIWAAGGDARRLACSGGDLAGVHTLRDRRDVDALEQELRGTDGAIVVIGGGYIGLEAAAVLTKMGRHVILLEMLDRVLARVAGEPLSRFFEAEHRSHGVDIRLEVGVECLEEANGRVCGVRLAGGEIIPTGIVVVGIGIQAAVEPLIAAGAEGSNGVDVDEYCRTSLPDIYAIGDCAAHENRFAGGRRIRLESVQNANDQAATAAAHILGQEKPYSATPWFWSNQFDLRLQTVGLSHDHDREVVRGDPGSRAFSLLYLKAGKVIALDCVNAVRDYVQGRKLVEAGAMVDPERLADASTPLKEMIG